MPNPRLPDTLIIAGDESSRLDPLLPDGGLPLLPGVQSFQVFRASKAAAEITDGKAWTYHHHVDMACWKGLLYVGWNSCERDEDVWPSRELYSTSSDSAAWSEPKELFPQGLSTCLRMYFFHAPVGRMLAIAGLRTSTNDTDEDLKAGLIVREIFADHRLGEVFTLQPTSESSTSALPLFTQCSDEGFVQACRELLADTVYLEQQDRGRLLGARRMKWHDEANWPGGKVPGDNAKWVAGKAYSFFRRPDGVLVGVSKMGWTTWSHDDGATWSRPVVPETLVTGKAKVWAQQTSDGRFALVYNPSRDQRFPLAITTSDDGVHFSPLRIVQGELPVQRYAGEHRSIGPQYVRGISKWSDDGSRNDNCMWLVYSMSKEDIWVSRVPMQADRGSPPPVKENFLSFAPGPFIPGWNTYCPKWSRVEISNLKGSTPEYLLLRNSDPHDYACATRVFPPARRVSVLLRLSAGQCDRGRLEIDVCSGASRRPIQIVLNGFGKITANDRTIGEYPPNQFFSFLVEADLNQSTFGVSPSGETPNKVMIPFAEAAEDFNCISFRTGPYRGIGGVRPIDPATDRPIEPVEYRLQSLLIR